MFLDKKIGQSNNSNEKVIRNSKPIFTSKTNNSSEKSSEKSKILTKNNSQEREKIAGKNPNTFNINFLNAKNFQQTKVLASPRDIKEERKVMQGDK